MIFIVKFLKLFTECRGERLMKLTKREKEILKMLCLPNKSIAKKLNISLSTTKRHINHIFNKLYTPANRASIVIEALKQNIIKLEEVITE